MTPRLIPSPALAARADADAIADAIAYGAPGRVPPPVQPGRVCTAAGCAHNRHPELAPEPCGCPPGAHDEGEPGGFYVTMKRGARTAWLLGPYATHEEALGKVPAAKVLAGLADPGAHFDAFGTSRVKGAVRPPGVLNARYEAGRTDL